MKSAPRRGTSSCIAVALAAAASLSPEAKALGWLDRAVPLQRLPVSGHELVVHPFQQAGHAASALKSRASGFGLFDSGQLSFKDAFGRFLRSGQLNPLVEVRGTTSATGLGLTGGGTSSVDYGFYVGGVPLCGFQVRAHQLPDRSLFVLGNVPDVGLNEPLPERDWPDYDLAAATAVQETREQTGAVNAGVTSHSRCLYVANNQLLPVWQLEVLADGLPYRVLGDAYEVITLSPGFLDAVSGTGKAYPFNRLDPATVQVAFKDLVGDGTLSSELLKTIVPSGYAKATQAEHTYNYAPTDKRFDEVQAYATAQGHLDYFTKLGFSWYGPKPLEIRLHTAPANRPNNALFVPGSESSGTKPSITIDDGDGQVLQNLSTDGDVLSHEFGHHVIFRTLHETTGESLVLHEGLADFFAFSRTGNTCLGESICPKGSPACVVDGQCLRTADNTLVYNDATWKQWAGGSRNRLGHLHGQLISGMLWDLRRGDATIPGDELAQTVMQAISYFKGNSGFRDLILSLLAADKALNSFRNEAAIRKVATDRGLGEFFADIPVGSSPVIEGSSLISDPAPDTAKRSKGKTNPFKCSTIMQAGSGASTWLPLLLLLPLLLTLRPTRTPVPVPVRARRPGGKQPPNKGEPPPAR